MWLLFLILFDILEKYIVNINICEDISIRINNYKMLFKRLELVFIFVFLFFFLVFKGFFVYGLVYIKL